MNLNDIGLIETDDLSALTSRMRVQRDRLLAASDWTQVADAPVDQQAWADYRQQLRDAPANWTPGPVWDAPEPPN